MRTLPSAVLSPSRHGEPSDAPARGPVWPWLAAVGSVLVGLALMADSLRRSSATYDEVAYLQVAARWWRTGDQERITRMGSPLTFWKLQQVPTLWLLDRAGYGRWLDDPTAYQAQLLPVARVGALWIWVVALALTAGWSRVLYGPRAMALAAALFALSPNLLAHGAILTMEAPIVACTVGMFFLFWRFLRRGEPWSLVATAALGGLAFSCKFTTVVFVPLFGVFWWVERWRNGERRAVRLSIRVALGMLALVAVLLLANFAVTGFAVMPLSKNRGAHPLLDARLGTTLGRLATRAVETPIPRDWVGFAIQMHHQQKGGWSYLFGERRMTGWWYYYLVALAVKMPLSFGLLTAARAVLGRSSPPRDRGDWILPATILAFLAITALGSKRNYGFRYLLPLAPLAIVWVSALAERGRWARGVAVLGLIGQALAVAWCHPHELAYFNVVAGGPAGGRRILSDSNLDWSQGARELAALQRRRPELRDLTLYYFGDTDPAHYGVVGRRYVVTALNRPSELPPRLAADTRYLGVSASLQWGPWGPSGYFRSLDGIEPVALLEDCSIAIYRTADVPGLGSPDHRDDNSQSPSAAIRSKP